MFGLLRELYANPAYLTSTTINVLVVVQHQLISILDFCVNMSSIFLLIYSLTTFTMIIHGQEKGTSIEDTNLANELKAAYFSGDVFTIALKNPDDYFAQNKIKDLVNEENVSNVLRHNVKCIMNNVKSYQAWHHRKYILNKFFCIENEYFLINECLRNDRRNFHCWNYLKWLIRALQCKVKNLANETGERNEKHDRKTYKISNERSGSESDVIKEIAVQKTNSDVQMTVSGTFDDFLATLDSLEQIPKKFYNLDFSNFSAIHSLNEGDYIDKLFTDPFDEGLWILHRKAKDALMFANRSFYIKIYDNTIEVILDKFVNSIVLQVNDTSYILESEYKLKRYTKNHVLCLGDTLSITINKIRYTSIFEGKIGVLDSFVDEILEIEEDCHFAWCEKLRCIKEESKRSNIVDKLIRIDAMRSEYYKDLRFCYIL